MKPNETYSHLQMLESADVMRLFRFSKTTLWRHVKDGTFPEPIRIGRSALWHEETVMRWLSREHSLNVKAAQPKKRDLDEFC